jgi:uncharacterized protein YbjT (DUF2867 family)
MSTKEDVMTRQKPILVLGSTGKTGRRVVERLTARGIPTRAGTRSAEPRFDWDDRDTPVLQGVGWAPRYRGGGAGVEQAGVVLKPASTGTRASWGERQTQPADAALP